MSFIILRNIGISTEKGDAIPRSDKSSAPNRKLESPIHTENIMEISGEIYSPSHIPYIMEIESTNALLSWTRHPFVTN